MLICLYPHLLEFLVVLVQSSGSGLASMYGPEYIATVLYWTWDLWHIHMLILICFLIRYTSAEICKFIL